MIIQNGTQVQFVSAGDETRIPKVQIASGDDARIPLVTVASGDVSRVVRVQQADAGDSSRVQKIRLQPWDMPWVTEYWDASYGVTSSGERVSSWVGRKGLYTLEQATGANQPILLPYSGTNYLYLSGVSGNYAITNASPTITNLDVRFQIALNAYVPASAMTVISQYNATGNQRSWAIDVGTTGGLFLGVSTDGSAYAGSQIGSNILAGYSNFSKNWFRITRADSNGAITAYVSTDYDPGNINSGTWTSIGTGTSTSGALFDSTQTIDIGTYQSGTGQLLAGKVYRAQVLSGGAVVFDANFTAVSEGATSFTESSSNGATVTINSTGAKPAQIVGSQQLLFDGAAHGIGSALSIDQPLTLLATLNQRSWTDGDCFVDFGSSTALIYQTPTSSPNLTLYAGTGFVTATTASLNAWKTLAATLNGASSAMQVNLGSPVTGNAGAGDPTGIYLGSTSAGSSFWNGQVKSLALCNTALNTAKLTAQITAEGRYHGVSL